MDNGTTASYTFNALGWRVEKRVGTAYTEVLYDQSGESLGENNRTTWTQSYVNPSLRSGQAFMGRHIAIYQNNATYFTHVNALGSATAVTDYTGGFVQEKLFYPWGQDWALAGTLYEERFAKLQHRDTETGFDPTPHRTYCAAYGRWLSPDPWFGDVPDPQSLNRYAYVNGNPLRRTDASGLFCEEIAATSDVVDEFDWVFYSYGGEEPGVSIDAGAASYNLGAAGASLWGGGCGSHGGGGAFSFTLPVLPRAVHMSGAFVQFLIGSTPTLTPTVQLG